MRATLTSLEGVEKVDVNFAKKTATVVMAQGKKLDEKTVTKALKAKKYGVTKFQPVSKKAKTAEAYYVAKISGMT